MEDSEREDRHRDWRLPPDSKDETYGDRLVRISRMGGEFLEKSGMAEEIRLRAKLMEGGTPQEMRRARAEWDAFQPETADREGNIRRLTTAERLHAGRRNPAGTQDDATAAEREQESRRDAGREE